MQHIITGFASENVIEKLREEKWTPCSGGENFSPIGIAGYCLCRPPDRIAPLKVTVVVTRVGTADSFTVEGYCSTDLFVGLKKGPPVWGTNKLFELELGPEPSDKNPELYQILVQAA